jgi:alkylation response protein AidB-like acyl-CoA dehydrogenase
VTAMRFDDSEAQRFRDRVSAWLRESRLPQWDERLETELSFDETVEMRRRWDAMVWGGGFAGITWPVAYGGLGLGPIEEFIFYEEAAAAGAPDMLNFIGYDLAGPALIEFGTPEQQANYLPRILRAEEVWCEGFSEPDAGSDMAAVSTTAVEVPGGWSVTGQKMWTSVAQVADLCYLLARTSTSSPRHRNLSVLITPMVQDGVEVRPIRQITDEFEFSEVFFSEAFVPAENLLGALNEGWQLGTLAGFRKGRVVKDGMRRYVLMRAAMNILLSCAREMGQSEPWRLNREVRLLRWHLMRAAESLASGREQGGLGSVTRLIWSELWQRVTAEGLRTGCERHEGYWQREYLYTRSVTIAGGTSQIQRNVIANSVIGLPR